MTHERFCLIKKPGYWRVCCYINAPGLRVRGMASSQSPVRIMAGVRIKENEPIESAIRRFKKQCEKAGILAELRKREHYEKPSVRRKRKAMAARKRALRRAARSALAPS